LAEETLKMQNLALLVSSRVLLSRMLSILLLDSLLLAILFINFVVVVVIAGII
jgi:hypothetical protein